MKALLLAAMLAGCYQNYYLRPNELPPAVAQITPEQRLAAWNRVVAVLLDEGYVPTLMDPTTCFVSAKFRDDIEVGKLTGTLALVAISPEGKLRVSVAGHGTYAVGHEDDFKHDMLGEQDRITKEILATQPAPPPRS